MKRKDGVKWLEDARGEEHQQGLVGRRLGGKSAWLVKPVELSEPDAGLAVCAVTSSQSGLTAGKGGREEL
jgi:hypothetical protein